MCAVAVKRRPPVAARRAGYVVAGTINVILLYLINGRPGWDAAPFLTADTTRVLALVNLSLVAGVVVNLVQVVRDPPWLVALTGMVTIAIGVAVLIRLWQVFPLRFDQSPVDWALLARILLALGVAGSIAGLITQAVTLARSLSRTVGRGHMTPR